MIQKSSIVIALTKVKQGITFFEDFMRDTKGGKGESMAKKYIQKLDWVLLDFKTNPNFSDAIRASIEQELQSDDLQSDAIYHKINLLHSNQRDLVEEIIDGILKGEKIEFVGK